MPAITPRPLVFAVLLALGTALDAPIRGADNPAAPVVSGPPAIRTVAEAFARWPELTSSDEPVELEGVVTGTMPTGAFRLHDGNLGLFMSRSTPGQNLTPGDRVHVSGFLRHGGFSPWVMPRHVTKIGRGAFPAARPADYSLLASGAADNQWLEIEGVVRAVQIPEPRDFALLDLGMLGGTLRVLVNYEPNRPFAGLVDAAVRLRGVAAVNVNKLGHMVEPSFRVPSFAEIEVVDAAPRDAFAQKLTPLERILKFSPSVTHQHRVRTRGVVTRQLSKTMFFIRDGGIGLKVESARDVAFEPGDVVEAAGFPVMADGMAVLQQAVCRGVAQEARPVPVAAPLARLLDGTSNSDLVSVRARLVDWAVAGHNVTLILESGDQLFKALINVPAGAGPALPAKDSVVNVTGVCVISELEDLWYYRPRSFLLLVATLADVHVTQAPPWWTAERLLAALGIAGAILFAVAGWVWALRRQVERTRAVIEQQARHAAALEERSRIARDLHDTLEQGLTGLSLQMKAMETDLDGTAHPLRERLHFARQMLRQSRALARNSIRELRAEALPPRVDGLINGLKRMVASWNYSGALAVTLEITGSPQPMSTQLEYHLVGIATEAVTNAVKHGRATAIAVRVDFGAAGVRLLVKDNGVGFEPLEHLEKTSGCFGLLGMRERAREVSGQLHIQSERGRGTEVVVTAPLPSATPPVPATIAEALLVKTFRSAPAAS
jgi:signal transduction histidine kinase